MKKILLFWGLALITLASFSQTTLGPGDIAFLGINTDGATDADDNFAFVLLKDIDAATQIIFTDRGWTDGVGFWNTTPGDGEFTWTSGVDRNAGEVIILDFNSFMPQPSFSFTQNGDQLFAIQGSLTTPTFIAGLHFNVVTGTTDDANWDGAATSNTTSALPDALTTGDTAIRLTGPGGVENDNFQFSCAIAGCPLSGTPDELRAIIHDSSNWISSNTTPFAGTVDAGFGTPTVGDTTPPMIVSVDPTNGATDVAIDAILTVTFDEPVQWVNGGNSINVLTAASTGIAILQENDPRVTFSGNSLIIDLTTDFEYESGYQVVISFNTLQDAAGNIVLSSPGSDWSFTTVAAPCEVSIDTQPEDESICLDGTTTVTGVIGVMASTPVGNLSYQWEQLLAGQTIWSEIGITDAEIVFQSPPVTWDGSQYRVIVTSDNGTPGDDTDDCSVTSDVVTLTVNPLPVVTFMAPTDVQEDVGVLVGNAGGSPAPGSETGDSGSYSGPGVTDNGDGTYDFDPSAAGVGIHTITYTYTNGNGCENSASDDIEVTEAPEELVPVFVYRYTDFNQNGSDDDGGAFETGWEYKIYDENGVEVGSDITGSGASGATDNRAGLGDFPPGTYTVCEVPQANWINTDPGGASVADPLGNSRSCEEVIIQSGNNFKNLFFGGYLEPQCTVEIDTQPQDTTVCRDEEYSFSVEASGSGNLSYEWQQNIEGQFWTIGGFETAEFLSIANSFTDSGTQFRVKVTSDNGTPNDESDDCSVTSNEVTLTVNELPQEPGIAEELATCSAPGTLFLSSLLQDQKYQVSEDGGATFNDFNAFQYPLPQGPAAAFSVQFKTINTVTGCESAIVTIDVPELVCPDPEIIIDDVTQAEGTGGTTTFVFTVTLSQASSNMISVDYETIDGTALAIEDYTEEESTLTFNPGETSKSFDIDVNPDSDFESDETFFIELVDPVNATIADNEGVGTILNDDVQPECQVEILTHPQSVELCENEAHTFQVLASGSGTITYDWQQSTDGGVTWTSNPDYANGGTSRYFGGGFVNISGFQYRVEATSDNGTPDDASDDCSVTTDVAITTINPLPIANITGNSTFCYNGNGVTLDAGAGYTSYLWSPGGQTTQSITALAGNYTVTVTNQEGCARTSQVFEVTQSELLTCSIEQTKLTTDHTTYDGVATVYPIGGTAPFTYVWDNGETGQTATTLSYGMHSVTVTDANGCVTSCEIDIAKELYCWINLIQNVSEYGGKDGAARVSGNGGYRPFTFKWDDGSTQQTNNSLMAGIHHVTITDAKGATSQCSITIMEPTGSACDKFTSDVEQVKLTTDHLTEDGVAMVTPYGGTAPYTYYWDNGETTQTATTLTYGMHSVTVTDANGCESMSYIDIAKELYCWINLYGNVTVHGGSDGSAKVHGNGGYRPFTYRWDDGTTDQLNTNLKAGTHYVTIIDATGATSRCSITVTQPNEEICDGVDNDGDGEVDEGFDQDGDGIADCYDKCPNGDDSVDEDGDGIPDACDDVVCIKLEMPQTACYETAIWNPDNCRWDIVGEQPEMPETECYETAVWNAQTCSWDIVDGQPEMPVTECYETAVWNAQTCSWDIVGEQPEMPETECYETADWNAQTCSWDIVDGQPEMPETECYETAVWNAQTCSWDIVGEQPEMPVTECYETATWNPDTCEWEIKGEQPEMPETLCYETAIWNSDTCEWDIIQDGNPSCAGGSIDECETAFARSSDSSTCFEDIPNFNTPRWGWTNVFPSIDGTYQMDLYAAAGQCDLSKGALVGSVQVVYSGGSVSVSVSTLGGYKMTEAQLHVGTDPIPTNPNNGNLTVAPGQYAYKYEPGSDFTNYTFEDIGTGDADTFYVILHANVCPLDEVAKRQVANVELKGYPIPFKNDITIEVLSPSDTKSKLYLYGTLGQKVRDFGSHKLRRGKNEIVLSVGELSPGMYFIHLSSEYGREIIKVLNEQ